MAKWAAQVLLKITNANVQTPKKSQEADQQKKER
jgi:hypothetical protein